jgi:hypothetical protein
MWYMVKALYSNVDIRLVSDEVKFGTPFVPFYLSLVSSKMN